LDDGTHPLYISLPWRLCHNYILASNIPSPLIKGEKAQSRTLLHKSSTTGWRKAVDEGLHKNNIFNAFLVEPLTPTLSPLAWGEGKKDSGVFDRGWGKKVIFKASTDAPRRSSGVYSSSFSL
jgi:hypothetical protein